MESNKHQCEDYIIPSDAETEVWEGESHTEVYQQEEKYEMSELWYVKKKINKTRGLQLIP